MSNTINGVVICAPTLTASLIAAVTQASPMEYGVVGVCLTLGLLPILRWMMSRQDKMQDEANDLAKRREEREDKQIETFQGMMLELRLLNDHHARMADRLDSIDEKLGGKVT